MHYQRTASAGDTRTDIKARYVRFQGQSRLFATTLRMSAIGGKADIGGVTNAQYDTGCAEGTAGIEFEIGTA